MSLRPLLFAIALAACGHAGERAQPLSNHASAGAAGALAVGDYACRIEEGGYQYPPFHCVVARRPEGLWLEKVEGSVRFRGTVTAQGDGFAFDGEQYCPWGDCTERVHTVFAPVGGASYRGTMTSAQSGPSTVTLTFVPGGYGGDGYGGAGYGGDGYGGAVYGAGPPRDDP